MLDTRKKLTLVLVAVAVFILIVNTLANVPDFKAISYILIIAGFIASVLSMTILIGYKVTKKEVKEMYPYEDDDDSFYDEE